MTANTTSESAVVYLAYGLRIRSDFRLPGLPLGEDGPEDIVIHSGKVAPSASIGASEEEYVSGRILDELWFSVESGRRITVDLKKPLQGEVLQGYVLGVLMAALLRQRGLLVLHASCVYGDGVAIGFVGESGWGKSTLAEYFCQQGYELINDDALAIDVHHASGIPTVIPGFAQVRLRPASGVVLREDFHQLPRMHERSTKRLNVAPPWRGKSAPLAALYVLSDRYEEANDVRSLSKREALIELVRHTRVTNLVWGQTSQIRHLELCANLLGEIPVVHLQRSHGLQMLPELRLKVERHLQANLPQPVSG